MDVVGDSEEVKHSHLEQLTYMEQVNRYIYDHITSEKVTAEDVLLLGSVLHMHSDI